MALDEVTNTSPEIDDDLNTTAPQSKPAPWSMPEPVYRRTSGKLPQGYAKAMESEPSSPEILSASTEVSSDSHPPVPAPAPVVKPKSSVLKMLVLVLALAAMIGFIAVFLTVLYFFFLRS